MTRADDDAINPATDLVLERTVDVPRELVWQAWTTPKHVKEWITPKPWQTIECQIDLRPGGIFRFVMQSPEGQKFPHVCCYLEIVPNERVVWTSALGPGFRPQSGETEVPVFTAKILLAPIPGGTKYTAIAMHKDEAGAKKHADMGFHEGWGIVTDQLAAYAKTL